MQRVPRQKRPAKTAAIRIRVIARNANVRGDLAALYVRNGKQVSTERHRPAELR